MSYNTELEAEWADKEIAKLNRLTAKEENEMRDEARLSQISNSIGRTQSPRNFLTSMSLPRPHQAHILETSESPQTIARSNSTQMPDNLGQCGSLETYSRFNFEALQHALKQALIGGQRNDVSTRAGQVESTAETEANDQESELESAFLKDSDEENEDGYEDEDENWEEYFDCEEILSDKDYFFHDGVLQEELSGYQNNQAERGSEGDESEFAAHLFRNPLQSLEDQENNVAFSPPNSTKPNKPPKKSSSRKVSRTWVTRFLANKQKSRPRRMPRGPGRYIYPSSGDVLLLLMKGININGARPTRGDTELLRHQKHRKAGQYVSFSSPLRYCWTYISCEEEDG
ncbi:hypothetical protein BOTCAL_0031g00100 [Botryotinia calthae]|uniref:Uncharacterized protein n=1 Tax=Botryotinia calthae TaxID=38488 RepID=A0A4Y8DDN4_9HELO|nr:hypothetical protein BOTCAL_0031g00100 [Botryotinia calthae]